MRRAAWAVAAVCVLSGCAFTTIPPPSTPMTYCWDMVFHGPASDPDWLVQIGPKRDALHGLVVGVYGWSRDGYEYFHPLPLEPSRDDYGIVWQPDGWHMMYAGDTVDVINIGSPEGVTVQHNICEHTTQ